MNTTKTGNQGEQAAVEYLGCQGFEVLERNFKTPQCEIDIVARKSNCLYFVEVKYRRSDQQGGGFEAITAKKLRQMARAATIWQQAHAWHGEVTLAAIEVASDYEVTEFIESLA